MFLTNSGGYSFTVAVPNEEATRRLVIDVAAVVLVGDLVTLSGDLGAGKTTFARSLIRHLAGDETIEVPSPTFTLMQIYDLPKYTVVHADLYRLSGPSELSELGFEDIAERAITLLEWPDRAAGVLPPDRIDIAFTLVPQQGETFRHVRITGYGTFAPRVERMAHIRRFLARTGLAQAERHPMQGDASTRAYERITLDHARYVLMNAPRRPDGPPVRDGKPYSRIAHLAEDVTPFVAMAKALRARGLSAPDIVAEDRDAGLLLLEDLGNEPVVGGTPPAPIEDRYEAAVDVLAELHRVQVPHVLEVAPGVEYRVPHYGMDAMMIEVELMLDWYLPKLEAHLSDAKRKAYLTLWRTVLEPAARAEPTWVLRDYHSPNLLWLPERHGIQRVGLLDFQDAVMGPCAYDVASLLQDARVDVPELLEIALLSRYTRARLKADPAFDAPGFVQLYATMCAQRASKILGIFARLDKRDGKPQYLRHLPRVWAYLLRALAHPSLSALQSWYRTNVPRLKSL